MWEKNSKSLFLLFLSMVYKHLVIFLYPSDADDVSQVQFVGDDKSSSTSSQTTMLDRSSDDEMKKRTPSKLHLTVASNKTVDTRSISAILSAFEELAKILAMLGPIKVKVTKLEMSSQESRTKSYKANPKAITFGINRPVLAHAVSFVSSEQELILEKIGRLLNRTHGTSSKHSASTTAKDRIYHITTKTEPIHSIVGEMLQSLEGLTLDRIVVKESGHAKSLCSISLGQISRSPSLE